MIKPRFLRAIVLADDDDLVGHLPDTTADVLLCLGDLSDLTLEKALVRYSCQKALAVKGNHDTDRPFPPGVTPLHLDVVHYYGFSFGGFNGCWKYKAKGPHLYEQEEVSRMLREFPKVDVFVAHNSPFGIHERDTEVHQGFRGLQEYIVRAQPRYFLHGHQHRNQQTQIGNTRVIGVYGETALHLD